MKKVVKFNVSAIDTGIQMNDIDALTKHTLTQSNILFGDKNKNVYKLIFRETNIATVQLFC